MLDVINTVVKAVNKVVWGWPMIVLLFGTHIFMTVRTGGIQRYIFRGIRLSVAKDPDGEGEVSQFGALTTALASTIGTGNIIGVGTAVALGGPGAVLWCWLTGVFGIATKYSEALIAVKYRVKTEDGRMQGGAMYALEYGLKNKKLGKALGLMLLFLRHLHHLESVVPHRSMQLLLYVKKIWGFSPGSLGLLWRFVLRS